MSTAKVDAWFETYENQLKAEVQLVREIIMAADERMEEIIKWQAPTFMYKVNLASFFPKSKKHVSLMFHNGAQISGDFPNLEGTGEQARTMKFESSDDIQAKKSELESIVKAWITMKG